MQVNNACNIPEEYKDENKNNKKLKEVDEKTSDLGKRIAEGAAEDGLIVDLDLLNAVDLTKFRNSDLPSDSYWLILLPVIGWIALPCLKIYCVWKHRQVENMMKEKDFDSTEETAEKIGVLEEVIEKSGLLAWQYQLELAKLQLLNNQASDAKKTLKDAYQWRGSPEQTGRYNVRKVELVSWKRAERGNWVDGSHVIAITYYTYEEAILYGSVFADDKDTTLAQAYDAYNHAIYYAPSLRAKIRPLQVNLARKMQEKEGDLTDRELDIVEKEKTYYARQKSAKGAKIRHIPES